MRTEAIGLGLFVAQDTDTGRVRAAVERLVSDPSYRVAGAAARSGLERMPSLEEGLRLIEGLSGG